MTPPGDGARVGGALPTVIVIGAMKCATSAVHRFLDAHPDVAMSTPKELNFFFGDGPTAPDADEYRHEGTWTRGLAWYMRHFPADAAVRGESSPGYTSPDHPGVAARMAAVVPDVRLVYMVRDPVDRALSQYRHHAAEGDERRPPDVALLDPDSQYVARGRYLERLEPFLAHYPLERIHVIATEDLLHDRRTTLAGLYRHVGVDPGAVDRSAVGPGDVDRVPPRGPSRADADLRRRLAPAFADDAERFRALLGREFPRWGV